MRPHMACIYSLTFMNTARDTVNALLELCPYDGASGSLKSLAIDDCQSPGYAPSMQQPTVYPQGLLHLQLRRTRITFEQLATALSSSELLQTLRFRSMIILPGMVATISLPRLQMLDVIDLEPRGLLFLLFALFPGRLELDLRLSLDRLSPQGITDVIGPFCKRANVASLNLSNSASVPSAKFTLLLSFVPLIRVLVLKDLSDYFESLDSVTVAVHGGHVAWCPKLRTLCLIGNGKMSRDAVVRVKRVVESYKLGTIILDDCKLASNIGDDPNYSKDTQKNIKADFWECLSNRVKTIITYEYVLGYGDSNEDLYVRRLIEESQEA
ncbi:hypothetical protein FRC12_009868 [Ceratobasidium sp. 428]|nr:hypothetical protein FRC12_009868 [Ceratobasidium sp. 428]